MKAMNRTTARALAGLLTLATGVLAADVSAAQALDPRKPKQLPNVTAHNQPTRPPLDGAQRQPVWPGAESALPHDPQASTAGRAAAVTAEPQPFGANLFSRPLQLERPDSLNPDYVIVPGDQIAVHVWGAAQTEEVAVVDPQGNIFIDNIGPVRVAGTRAADLDRRVREAVASVYTQNVDVYVNLLTTTPVEVFVTGAVAYPGQYAGTPSDSVLTFLHRAGGIDPKRGSYRKIRVLRNGRTTLNADLYQFLRDGRVPQARFRDGDVILVDERGPSVTVEGPTLNPFRFELSGEKVPGQELVAMTRPLPHASHVSVAGNRPGGRFSVYVGHDEFSAFMLEDGDSLRFEADQQTPTMTVAIEGSNISPSTYTVARDSTLRDFLDHVWVDPDVAATDSVYIRRQSVASQQRELLDRTLRQLEQSVLTAPTRSDGESDIRAREAELVQKFVTQAREVRPEGRVVVSENGRAANIRLEPNDVVVIPTKTDVVLVGGEVLMPQAIIYNPEFGVDDYVRRSGGYTDRADQGRVTLIHQNGVVEMGDNPQVRPGDQVIIMPEVEFKSLQIAKDVIQIFYQIAIAAAVVMVL
jgi:protein involved in polysaccharide export with SLBB domain